MQILQLQRFLREGVYHAIGAGAVVIDRRSILLQPVINRASSVIQNGAPSIAVNRRPVPAGPGRDNPGPAGAHASNVNTTSKALLDQH